MTTNHLLPKARYSNPPILLNDDNQVNQGQGYLQGSSGINPYCVSFEQGQFSLGEDFLCGLAEDAGVDDDDDDDAQANNGY